MEKFYRVSVFFRTVDFPCPFDGASLIDYGNGDSQLLFQMLRQDSRIGIRVSACLSRHHQVNIAVRI